MFYFKMMFYILLFWKVSTVAFQYETVTCEGPVQKPHKVSRNTFTYFQTKYFPYHPMKYVNEINALVCNILFETEVGMKLWMMLYNGGNVDRHYPFLKMFEDSSQENLCPYQNEIIPLEEGKIIPVISSYYLKRKPQNCVFNFKLKNPGKNVKFVYNKIEDFLTLPISTIEYHETNEDGEYTLTYANNNNISFVGHISVSDVNYKYSSKICSNDRSKNRVEVYNINYDAYERCYYDIVIPEDHIIEVTVEVLQIEKFADKLWLEDMNGREIKSITANTSKHFNLAYNAKLIFQSDGSIQQFGFRLCFEETSKLQNLWPKAFNAFEIPVIILALVIIILLFAAIYGLCRWVYKIKKYEKVQESEIESADIKDLYQKYFIPIRKIKQCSKIGTGASADVYLAVYKNGNTLTKVAVKKLKDDTLEADTLQEINFLSSCKHKNIVQFIGWIKKEEQISIITEFMGGGELHAYLLNSEKLLMVSTVFSYILQVLDAMTYLSHKHILHRDLAARNCLLNATFDILKINDFGLARQTDVNYEYISEANPKLPFRWLPLEALQPPPQQYFKTFSYKGDIWSFGVLIWEMFERSGNLYNNMGFRDLVKFLKRGQRLSRPYHCPLEIYSLMLECWDEKPENRPIFDGLQIQIKNIFLEMKTHHLDALNVAIEIGSGYEHPNN